MTISVSTDFCSSWMPISARRMRRAPSKWNGLVTTPTVRMPLLRAAWATTGAAPVPVPPPMPAVTKHMWVPFRWSMISSRHSSAAARPTSGCEPAPRPSVTWAPIWMMRVALVMVSAWASVLATTKSTPSRPAVIMLLTAFPPPPPTPKTVMRGFSSVISGFCSLIVMVPFLLTLAASPSADLLQFFMTPPCGWKRQKLSFSHWPMRDRRPLPLPREAIRPPCDACVSMSATCG